VPKAAASRVMAGFNAGWKGRAGADMRTTPWDVNAMAIVVFCFPFKNYRLSLSQNFAILNLYQGRFLECLLHRKTNVGMDMAHD
jgi:hypothetical protein